VFAFSVNACQLAGFVAHVQRNQDATGLFGNSGLLAYPCDGSMTLRGLAEDGANADANADADAEVVQPHESTAVNIAICGYRAH
jgi:hypothetical protein